MKNALIELGPLPSITVQGKQYGRRRSGEWVGLNAHLRVDVWVPAGSLFAQALDTILALTSTPTAVHSLSHVTATFTRST
jgi:hypothetical protein